MNAPRRSWRFSKRTNTPCRYTCLMESHPRNLLCPAFQQHSLSRLTASLSCGTPAMRIGTAKSSSRIWKRSCRDYRTRIAVVTIKKCPCGHFLNIPADPLENGFLRGFRYAEFHDCLCGDLDLSPSRRISPHARLAIHLYQLSDAVDREHAICLYLLVGKLHQSVND